MPGTEPGKIRNVAVIGHRGTGKTSLVEALLFETGTVNRLGSVAEKTTVSDHDDEERRRGMSISASVTHLEWDGRTINLIDTPGEPSFQADVLGALRVVEGAIVSVSGVMGVEVGTERLWKRCDELGLARLVLVNLLDRERADFFTTLEALQTRLSPKCVAVELPIGREHEFHGVIDLVHMVAYDHGEGAGRDEPMEIPDDLRATADEYHDKLMDVVSETSDELMERYLEGGEISREEMAAAMKKLVTEGELFPVGCGAATRNIGSHGLLDLIVEGLPSPLRAKNLPEVGDAGTVAYVFKTIADPFSGKLNLLRVFSGEVKSDSTLVNNHSRSKERIGQLLTIQGKEHAPIEALCTGAIGAVAKLKETGTGDVLSDSDAAADIEPLGRARAGRVVRDRAEAQGRRGEGRDRPAPPQGGGSGARRPPRPADRRADRRRPLADARRGRPRADAPPVRRRGHAAPAARPVPRDDPQAVTRAGPLQEADRRAGPVRRLPHPARAAARPRGVRVRRQDRRRRHPAGVPAGGRQGDPGGDDARRARELPGGRRQGDARRRLLPHGRLVGDGVQDRRLDGVQEGLRRRRPDPARADHEPRTSPCPTNRSAT